MPRHSDSWTMYVKRLVNRGWSGLRKQIPSLKSVKAADNCFCIQRLFLNMRKLTATNSTSLFPLPLVTTTIFLPWLKRKSGSRKQVKRQPHLYVRCSKEHSMFHGSVILKIRSVFLVLIIFINKLNFTSQRFHWSIYYILCIWLPCPRRSTPQNQMADVTPESLSDMWGQREQMARGEIKEAMMSFEWTAKGFRLFVCYSTVFISVTQVSLLAVQQRVYQK